MTFSVLLQYLSPQHLLSRLTGKLAACRIRWFKNWAIRRLIRIHQVDVTEIVTADLADYPTFNSFFTRALRPDARPVAANPLSIVSPVDGCVSQAGTIQSGRLFQAKGFDYSLTALLAGNTAHAGLFESGRFATFYLAPRDYHRVHMPLQGKLVASVHVPGRLFSVNPQTASQVPGLFSRNERVVCLFETAAGPMAVILIGAMLVSQIQTVWSDTVSSQSSVFPAAPVLLEKGAEMGRFLMGSTVIVLFAHTRMSWHPDLQAGSRVQMGAAIGSLVSSLPHP